MGIFGDAAHASCVQVGVKFHSCDIAVFLSSVNMIFVLCALLLGFGQPSFLLLLKLKQHKYSCIKPLSHLCVGWIDGFERAFFSVLIFWLTHLI